MSRSILTAAAAIPMLLVVTPASAQRQQASPEQRIERLERQLQQVQRQVFPKGRPADTAGFADDPAASQSSVAAIAQRLDSLERQMTDLVRLAEENSNRQQTQDAEIERLRSDQERRLTELEQRIAAVAAQPTTETVQATAQPTVPLKSKPATPTPPPAAAAEVPAVEEDPAEAAYTQAFKLWEAGRYDEAITELRAFVSAYPKHRRVSFANNLIGRALLDKGEARAAVPAFIANYRGNPGGERAADSLYYLGQALLKLGQPAQACNAFAELDEVYGTKVRPELKKLSTEAKQQAQCKN
jgi:TolA-binding protein